MTLRTLGTISTWGRSRLGDDLDPGILLAAAEDDGSEQFPEAVDIADFGSEVLEATAWLLAVFFGLGFLGEVAFGDHEGGGEPVPLGRFVAIGEDGGGFGLAAHGPPGEAENVGQTVLDGGGGELWRLRLAPGCMTVAGPAASIGRR